MNKGFLMLSFYVNTDQIHSYERLLFIYADYSHMREKS